MNPQESLDGREFSDSISHLYHSSESAGVEGRDHRELPMSGSVLGRRRHSVRRRILLAVGAVLWSAFAGILSYDAYQAAQKYWWMRNPSSKINLSSFGKKPKSRAEFDKSFEELQHRYPRLDMQQYMSRIDELFHDSEEALARYGYPPLPEHFRLPVGTQGKPVIGAPGEIASVVSDYHYSLWNHVFDVFSTWDEQKDIRMIFRHVDFSTMRYALPHEMVHVMNQQHLPLRGHWTLDEALAMYLGSRIWLEQSVRLGTDDPFDYSSPEGSQSQVALGEDAERGAGVLEIPGIRISPQSYEIGELVEAVPGILTWPLPLDASVVRGSRWFDLMALHHYLAHQLLKGYCDEHPGFIQAWIAAMAALGSEAQVGLHELIELGEKVSPGFRKYMFSHPALRFHLNPGENTGDIGPRFSFVQAQDGKIFVCAPVFAPVALEDASGLYCSLLMPEGLKLRFRTLEGAYFSHYLVLDSPVVCMHTRDLPFMEELDAFVLELCDADGNILLSSELRKGR